MTSKTLQAIQEQDDPENPIAVGGNMAVYQIGPWKLVIEWKPKRRGRKTVWN